MSDKSESLSAEQALIKRWVDQWKITGPELERIKKRELRAMTEEEALRRVGAVMDARFAAPRQDPRRRDYSGLIEQQRIFTRLAAAKQ
jgi:hypothetical protein